jgi:hypothetical protein
MLSIVTSKQCTRRFLVYDLEWVPGSLKLRVCGVYDGTQYRCYKSIADFLDSELTSKNRGAWFYAHAGGMADMLFVFERMLERRGYEVHASFSGSSAIIVKVRKGKNCWWFIDSYWLFRDKLRNIAKSVGMQKGGIDDSDDEELSDRAFERRRAEIKEWYATVPIQELIEYNAQDCKILWTAIDRFEDEILSWGSVLMKTIASNGMQLFRRKFLKQTIETNNAVNEVARLSYFASRVEVFNRFVQDAYYYDINSSFPYAMTLPQPGEYLGTCKGRFPRRDDLLYIADVDIETADDYCPTVPTRVEGKVFFPVGRWRSWLTNVDVELLLREGGTVHKVYECHVFKPFFDLKDYALTIFEHRKNSKDPFQKIVDKYLLNCLYGKFAESPYKEALMIDPPPCNRCGYVDCRCRGNGVSIRMLMPGVWLKESLVPIPHMHVPISTNITSIGRRTLFDYMTPQSRFDYTDTDGFSCPDKIPTGKELGALKLEKRIIKGLFHAPKFYHLNAEVLDDKDGEEWWTVKRINHGKGFSRLHTERFFRLLEGEEVIYERMKRIKELYRAGNFRPKEEQITKSLSKNPITKRFTYPDGTTRPWHYKELQTIVPKARRIA